MDKPLFGEARPRDRYLNYFIGGATVLLVSETIISSLVFPKFPPTAINVFFAFIIALICTSELTLIYWYRQGDVDPKFRKMIYFNSVTTILLCICANVYFHKHCSWHRGTFQSLILHHLWTTTQTQTHTAQFVHSSEFVVTVHRLRPRHWIKNTSYSGTLM